MRFYHFDWILNISMVSFPKPLLERIIEKHSEREVSESLKSGCDTLIVPELNELLQGDLFLLQSGGKL